MCLIFLNVEYKNIQARIDLKGMKRFSQVQKEVLVAFKEIKIQTVCIYIQLWNKTTTEIIQIQTWLQLQGLPEAYFAEENGLFLTVELLSPPSRQPTSTDLTAATKRHLVPGQEIIGKYLTETT
jgi:hypothetical protein